MRQPPPLTQMLSALIESASVSSTQVHQDMSNLPVCTLLAGWLEDAGFSVNLMPVEGHAGKFNIIGTLGQGEGGLVLAGHTDTVPWDEGRWQHDPFKLTETHDRYYGLGTSDMKSFLALAIEASRAFEKQSFKKPLIILGTADEETSMSGAHALCAADLGRSRYAVIGEPTGLKPVRQHKGILMESIALTGQSGHSSDPAYGNSALEGMHEVMQALIEFRQQLQKNHHNDAFRVPVPTMNFGHICGGDNPNRICPDCELQLDLRPLPGMCVAVLRQDIRRISTDIALRRGLTVDFKALFAGIDAMNTNAASDIVIAVEQLTASDCETVAFGTEGPLLNQLGVDTVVLGPGDIAQAHQPDEYLLLERIPPTLGLLKSLIHRFCIQ
ncbi:unnamed protein product [Cyprideis torosa]|uniref:Uncharacterized protein n=1 Tax=Cyprideis torosa TaxID=163714 RepID=A0A7R8ZZ18_9CRUS|nr:unnamed protein product [Cyprideis torosa]CAG0909141.1 unnamed protein product [Cyprideis torosa]